MLSPHETEMRARRIVAMHGVGLTAKEIARAYEVTRQRVYQILKKSGVPGLRLVPLAEREDLAEIAEAYRDGVPTKKIARDFRISVKSIYKIVREAGIPLRPQVARRKDPPKEPEPKPDPSVLVDGAFARALADSRGAVAAPKPPPAEESIKEKHAKALKKSAEEMAAERKKRNRRIVAMAREGSTAKEIAAEFDLRQETISDILRKNGMRAKKPKRPNAFEDEELADQARALLRQDYTTGEVSDKLNIAQGQVTKFAFENNLTRYMRTPDPDSLIVKVNGSRFDSIDIACEEYGWTRRKLLSALRSGYTHIGEDHIEVENEYLERRRLEAANSRPDWWMGEAEPLEAD